MVDFADLVHVYTYNGDGTINTDTVTTSDGAVYVKTYSYTTGNLTGETAWIKQ